MAGRDNDGIGFSNMKIHLHRATVKGRIYQAYTRDKAGKALSSRVSLQEDGEEVVFKRSDWRYAEPSSIDLGNKSDGAQLIWQQLQEKGAAVAEIQKFPHVIYVYDLQFDTANARVYSLDEDLVRFKSRHKNLELSPMGDFLGFDEVKFIGKIEDRFYFDLEGMGIDLNQLLEAGFFLVKVLDVDPLEHQRRYMQRSLRREIPPKVAHLGVRVEDITIKSLAYSQKVTSAPADVPPSQPAININNNPTFNIGSVREGQIGKRLSWSAVVIAGIGFLSAILTILAYFEFDLNRMRAAIALLF